MAIDCLVWDAAFAACRPLVKRRQNGQNAANEPSRTLTFQNLHRPTIRSG
jgi:hypothetical protein